MVKILDEAMSQQNEKILESINALSGLIMGFLSQLNEPSFFIVLGYRKKKETAPSGWSWLRLVFPFRAFFVGTPPGVVLPVVLPWSSCCLYFFSSFSLWLFQWSSGVVAASPISLSILDVLHLPPCMFSISKNLISAQMSMFSFPIKLFIV